MYLYILVAMEVGLLDFGIYEQKGFFSLDDDAFGEKSGGFGKGLMRVVQCELLEGLVAWAWV
jgi:hypothetical protein